MKKIMISHQVKNTELLNEKAPVIGGRANVGLFEPTKKGRFME